MPKKKLSRKTEKTPSKRRASQENAEKPSKPADFPIVGIGASAGGLTALKQFFSHVPIDSGLAYVVVVHLSPEHKSHMAELLQPHIKMPVQQVTSTLALEKDHVYVIPPNANLNTIDTHLRLSKLEERRQQRAPIDHFFRTLAKTHDGDAIGIILTGTGSDGTLGLREIKEAGGMTIVQDPNEAEYDGMPQSAISTGLVDLILPLDKIPETVLRFTRTQPKLPQPREADQLEGNIRQLLQRMFAHLRARTSRDFSRYKTSTILRRIQRRMQLRHIEEFTSYLELLREAPEEVRILADDLLITVTSFFRDPEVFETLERDVIPTLFREKSVEDEIRVWSVGCATGEEAYSLAILLLEESARREVSPRLQVFASDLHEHSLQKARDGFYPGDIETDVSPERLKRYFIKEDSGYRIRKEIREMVIFSPHNLLSDPPFSRLDLISCRNLMIYIQREVQRDIVELFHYALRPDGFFILGSSETVEAGDLFRAVNKKHCVFRKRNVPGPEPRLPVFPMVRARLPGAAEPTGGKGEPAAYGALHHLMVERYALPSALVSPDDKLVHLSEHGGRYLTHPGGEPTNNILKIVREELRIELRALLRAARENGHAKRSKPILVRFDGESRPVVLQVRPALEPEQEGFILVIFDEREPEKSQPEAPPKPDTASSGPAQKKHIREQELEAELNLTQQRLQAIIEEYETSQEEMKASNEEMQSTNEELRSTMEELETSKEELQSMNEELQTVNQENRHKVEELAQLSSDLQNLLTATDIATLFLDRDLRILRFTSPVNDLFNIRTTDRGRPLSDLTHNLGYNQLQEDAQCVLDRLIPIEREVDDVSGRCFLTRILPYRSTEDRIEGIVMTFVDITSRKQAEKSLLESETKLATELEAMQRLHELVGQLLISPDLQSALNEVLLASIDITAAERGVVQLLNPESDVLEIVAQHGFSQNFLDHFRIVSGENPSACGRAIRRRERIVIDDVRTDPQYESHREAAQAAGYQAVQSTPLISRSGVLLGVLSTHYAQPCHPSERDMKILDLYARQATEFIEHVKNIEATRVADQRKDEFLALLAHELRNPLAPICTAWELMRMADDKAAAFEEIGGTLERQTQQLVRLVDDLLDVSRITRGKLELRKSQIQVADVIRDAQETSQRLIDESGHELTVSIPQQPIFLEADPHRLAQVFSNLLTNAAKYTPDGGQIQLRATRGNGEIQISVKDNGMGIPVEKQEFIFDIFGQIDSPMKQDSTGLGIGLSLVKSLVEMHGGSISVESDGPNHGSEFQVRLPILPEASEVETRAPEECESPATPQPQRVLIVDDSKSIRDLSSLMIKQLGHEVRTAGDGAEAVALAEEFLPDLVLMDLGMPNMDGCEAARHIRQQEWGKRMTLVALSGWGQDKDKQRSEEAGFDHHLIKPSKPDEIQRLLAESGRNKEQQPR